MEGGAAARDERWREGREEEERGKSLSLPPYFFKLNCSVHVTSRMGYFLYVYLKRLQLVLSNKIWGGKQPTEKKKLEARQFMYPNTAFACAHNNTDKLMSMHRHMTKK